MSVAIARVVCRSRQSYINTKGSRNRRTATLFPVRLLSTVVFDRQLKKSQRDFAYSLIEGDYYDYLRQESAARLADRLEDMTRTFPLALELGSFRGDVYRVINGQAALAGPGGMGGVQELVQADNFSRKYTEQSSDQWNSVAQRRVGELLVPTANVDSIVDQAGHILSPESLVKSYSVVCDEENLPFKERTFDMVLSSMSMHWINDLPIALKQINAVLKPDGVFLGSVLGGNTLKELRYCFYLAEQERRGGISPHVSPFAQPSDIAALMQAAGFNLPTIDIDTITVRLNRI